MTGSRENAPQDTPSVSLPIPHEPNSETMRRTIETLTMVNERYGKMLFATLGEGDKRVLMFPTPFLIEDTSNETPPASEGGILSRLLRRERNPSKAEISSPSSLNLHPKFKTQFLVIPTSGFKMIECGSSSRSKSEANVIGEFIGERMGRNPTRRAVDGKGYSGDYLEFRRMASFMWYITSPVGLGYQRDLNYETAVRDSSIVLVDADPDSVKHILELNIQRIQQIQSGAQITNDLLAKI